MLLVDGREGLVPGDERIARELRETGHPILLAINKTDDHRARSGAMEFYQLGFDPVTEKFNAFPSDMAGANVRQVNGRPDETWGGESGTNRLVVIQTVAPA